jgi:aspartyl-tRNA synthetase
MMRSHRCGDLRPGHIDHTVTLCGWVHSRRDHGGVTFIDLRDVAGLIQVVFNPDVSLDAHAAAQDLRGEYCVQVTGEVRARKEGTTNPKLPTGEIEVAASSLTVLAASDTPPFQIDEYHDADETIRLKYRFLDLRRERMLDNLLLRHRIIAEIRRFFDEEDFVEVETPLLTRATPEGARDYLVPSRLHPGRFYALPQSPQLYKQLLMVSGLDRYYQIARCLRDEDQRADRQPEFTQLDVEMSFVDVDDVLDVSERMFRRVWHEVLGVELGPFPRIPFREAMERFGSDKPDMRFGMELVDLGDVFASTEVKVFRTVLDDGGAVKAIVVPGRAGAPRKELDALVDEAKALGAGGLVWVGVTSEGFKSPLDKFFTDDERAGLVKATDANEDDLILIVADGRRDVVHKVLGGLRVRLAQRHGLIPVTDPGDPAHWKFVWIVEFPWFDWNDEEQRWDPIHHPFTGITEDTVDLLEKDPENVISKSYDITLNGWELASGSIRIHERALQERVFRALGISDAEAQEKFSFLLEAFRFGAPPHGGIAPGLDRVVAMAAGEENIREVIAFPKTQTASDPLTGAPAEVDEAQLRLLHLRSTAPREAKSAGSPPDSGG